MFDESDFLCDEGDFRYIIDKYKNRFEQSPDVRNACEKIPREMKENGFIIDELKSFETKGKEFTANIPFKIPLEASFMESLILSTLTSFLVTNVIILKIRKHFYTIMSIILETMRKNYVVVLIKEEKKKNRHGLLATISNQYGVK